MKMNRKEFEEFLDNYMYYILYKLDPVYYDEVKYTFRKFIERIVANYGR